MKNGHEPVALIGAGPIGIECAVALKRAGVDYFHIEKGQVGQTISWFPHMMRFFSSADRLAIAGVPVPRTDESKCTREEYLAYLRSVVLQYGLDIHLYEEVTGIDRDDSSFTITSVHRGRTHTYRASSVILATGDMHRARMLGIPGEDLAHVSHYFNEPHRYFRQRVLVVGSRNSAVEAAIRCHRCGADVTMSCRGDAVDPTMVKYWILPELEGFLRRDEIAVHYRTEPVSIDNDKVMLKRLDTGDMIEVQADFVLLMVGYTADTTLYRLAGIDLTGPEQRPELNEETMESSVPGVYVAGTATAGSQQLYGVFVENCHVHVKRIIASLTGSPPPENPYHYDYPES